MSSGGVQAVRDVDREALIEALSGGGGGGSGLTDTQLRASPVPVSGPLTSANLTAVTGTAAQTAVTTDPAAAGQTMLSVMRGILAELQTQTALLNDIKTNTAGAGV